MEPLDPARNRPEPPTGPDNLVDDGLGPEAADERPLADRHHGALRDAGHPEFFDVANRNLPEAVDLQERPERRLTVDDYASQVHGAGSRTQADLGGAPPSDAPGAPDPRDARPDAEPGST
jgi:hypothetical protein